MHRRIRGRGAWAPSAVGVAVCLTCACTADNPKFVRVAVDAVTAADVAGRADAGAEASPGADLAADRPAPADTGASGSLLDAAAGPPQTWMTEGLVGYWRFEDGSGMTARDSSGFGHDGRLENMGEMPWAPGHVGSGALQFAGDAGAGVRVRITPVLDAIRFFTISAWVKRGWQSGSDQHNILSRQFHSTNDELLSLSCLYGDAVTYIPRGSRNQIVQARAPLTAPASEWVHLAGSYDGSTLLLYENGREIARTSGLTVQLTGSVTDIFIGTNQNTTFNEPFVGTIDEVLLFSVALSPASIKVLASRGSPVGLR